MRTNVGDAWASRYINRLRAAKHEKLHILADMEIVWGKTADFGGMAGRARIFHA